VNRTTKKQLIWVIQARKSADAQSLFLSKSVVAVEWAKMGDLAAIPPTREAFRAAVATSYPNASVQTVLNDAAQLFEFAEMMQNQDFILYPSTSDESVHLGMVTSAYRHDPLAEYYPHLRSVKWISTVPTRRVSLATLSALNNPKNVFRIETREFPFLQSFAKHRTRLQTNAFQCLVRAVLFRDRWKCRVPECKRRTQIQAHHLKFRSRGGEDTEDNLLTLCKTCHEALHGGWLRIVGDEKVGDLKAGANLEFRFIDGWRPMKDCSIDKHGCRLTEA